MSAEAKEDIKFDAVALRALLKSLFVVDSHTLGAHWEYNNEVIAAKLGRVTTLLKPSLNEWHKTKEAGDFTHYGDNSLFLLESVADVGYFESKDFATHFLGRWATHKGFYDAHTRLTINNLKEGKVAPNCGADNSDLAGVGRIFVLLATHNDEASFVTAARLQTQTTQSPVNVVDTAELFARAAWRVLYGRLAPSVALTQAAALIKNEWIQQQVKKGLESANQDSEEAARSFGALKTFQKDGKEIKFYTAKACDINGGLLIALHLIAKFETAANADAVFEALVTNIAIGGDTAPRGVLAALLLFAAKGVPSQVTKLGEGLRQGKYIDQLLAKLSPTNPLAAVRSWYYAASPKKFESLDAPMNITSGFPGGRHTHTVASFFAELFPSVASSCASFSIELDDLHASPARYDATPSADKGTASVVTAVGNYVGVGKFSGRRFTSRFMHQFWVRHDTGLFFKYRQTADTATWLAAVSLKPRVLTLGKSTEIAQAVEAEQRAAGFDCTSLVVTNDAVADHNVARVLQLQSFDAVLIGHFVQEDKAWFDRLREITKAIPYVPISGPKDVTAALRKHFNIQIPDTLCQCLD